MAHLTPLPVDALLPDVVARLRGAPGLVLRSPTGSGKTTRIAPALEEAGFGPVALLEPRRLAARAAARRMADERGERLGERFGYRVRFESKVSARTRVTAMTEGVFLRRVLADPLLEGIGCVVFDEFHERHLDGDLALALARRIQREVRDDLRIVVLSATLDPTPVATFLGGEVIESEGRLFPVEVVHQPAFGREPIEDQVERAFDALATRTDGDVLVFLPGMAEIRRCEARLARHAKDLDVRPLHGDLSPGEQDAALVRGARRKVVLATNLAESSVTVEGVTAVIDSGLARIPRFDPGVGLDRLELGRISMESVRQRAGRAGREAPGLDVRLWSALDERSFAESLAPEVQRVDLAGAWLALADFGESDPAAFDWYEPPSAESGARAVALLESIGALAHGSVTPLGRELARLPLHPRLGRLLVAGRELGCLARTALAAALISERDPLRALLEERSEKRVVPSDVLERVELLEDIERRGSSRRAGGAIGHVLRARDQLLRLVGDGGRGRASRGSGRAGGTDEAFLRALFEAFADRLARRREMTAASAPKTKATRGQRRGQQARRVGDAPARMLGGRGVRLAPQCRARGSELFVCVEIDAGEGEGLVRQASRVDEAWLDPSGFEDGVECTFDGEKDAVRVRHTRAWHGLVLRESPASASDPAFADAVEEALARAAARSPERAFDLSASFEQVVARLRCLAEWGCGGPALRPPASPLDWIKENVRDLCIGRRSFADLKQLDLAAELLGRLDHATRAELDRLAPPRLPLPRNRSARVHYEPGKPPVLAARIQEFFGMTTNPTVAGGRVPVLVHLCAPNGRPEQITSDLAGFWTGSYARVRKDLRGRYPKHDWPEDPASYEPKPRGKTR